MCPLFILSYPLTRAFRHTSSLYFVPADCQWHLVNVLDNTLLFGSPETKLYSACIHFASLCWSLEKILLSETNNTNADWFRRINANGKGSYLTCLLVAIRLQTVIFLKWNYGYQSSYMEVFFKEIPVLTYWMLILGILNRPICITKKS